MEKLNPDKLTTTFRNVTPISPMIPRRYTLTHSDTTAELFLTIGWHYAYDEISPMRDEVLIEWRKTNNEYFLYGRVQVDAGVVPQRTSSAIRYEIFKRELPLALEAIFYGDRIFFNCHPMLNYVPIEIYFSSIYPAFEGITFWGEPVNYL